MTEQSECIFDILDRDTALDIWADLYNERPLCKEQLDELQALLSYALAQPVKRK